jgi:hypothetical protein
VVVAPEDALGPLSSGYDILLIPNTPSPNILRNFVVDVMKRCGINVINTMYDDDKYAGRSDSSGAISTLFGSSGFDVGLGG